MWVTAGAGDFPALGPSLAETLARFSLGTRKINFLASAQCRLIRIWHDHPFVHRRGGPGPRAAPRCPGDAHGDMPGLECVPGRARVPALCWQGCRMLTCREQNCSEGRGGPWFVGVWFILQSMSAAALCPAQPQLLLPPPHAVGNPRVPAPEQGRGGSCAPCLTCQLEPRTAGRLHRLCSRGGG